MVMSDQRPYAAAAQHRHIVTKGALIVGGKIGICASANKEPGDGTEIGSGC